MADEFVEKAQNLPVHAGGFVPVTNVPMPTKEVGQRSINITDLFITRWTPPWSRPPSLPAYTWRAWVLNQPIATVCREMLIAMLTGLDWNITARNSEQKKDLEATIKYYYQVLNHGGYYLGTDWTGLLEWCVGDLLDIPFGGAVEIGRRDDSPQGRVMWLKPLDGGTMYPTLNHDFPAVQYYQGYTAVAFPNYSIARMFMSPRQEIFREGWGIAPPEKIYFALDMLNRGDKYYANLLLDVPPAGILDLGDMEKSSAEDWVENFRTFVANTTDAFKIPVLYEHNNDVKFLPFGKVPNDIMFDHITLKYAAIVCAGYGLQLNDIGLQTTSRSGETLAGSIRASTQTQRTGIAKLKMKMKFFIEHILPSNLQFDWVDYDADLNVAMGRARLASATAFGQLFQIGAFTAQEIRSQMLFDGLVDVTVSNDLPPEAKKQTAALEKQPERPGALGHGVPPSLGGEGENKSIVLHHSKSADERMSVYIKDLVDAVSPRLIQFMSTISDDDLLLSKSIVTDSLLSDEVGLEAVLVDIVKRRAVTAIDTKSLRSVLGEVEGLHGVKIKDSKKKLLEETIKSHINDILAVAVVRNLCDVLWETQTQQIENLQVNWSEDVLDDTISQDYDYIMEETKSRTLNNLPATLGGFLEKEIRQIIQDKSGVEDGKESD